MTGIDTDKLAWGHYKDQIDQLIVEVRSDDYERKQDKLHKRKVKRPPKKHYLNERQKLIRAFVATNNTLPQGAELDQDKKPLDKDDLALKQMKWDTAVHLLAMDFYTGLEKRLKGGTTANIK